VSGLGALVLAGAQLLAMSSAATQLRIVPTDRATFAVGQRYDLRVEATNDAGEASAPPRGLRVFVDANEVTKRNLLDRGVGGERGAGGTGCTHPSIPANKRSGKAPPNSTNFLVRDLTFNSAGAHRIEARTDDGTKASVSITVFDWNRGRSGMPRARNVILFLGDGMGVAHRTAARVLARGVTAGRADGALAMDSLPITGEVMTASLDALITDSSPGMSTYVTGNKSNNDQEGVFPDNTEDPFDNPRFEYLGELLRRTRGPGFNVGLVTTADLTDATPAANAVHTSDRGAAGGISARYLDERETNGVTVLLGGGGRHFAARTQSGSSRKDDRNLLAEFPAHGYALLQTNRQLEDFLAGKTVPERILGLFNPGNMSVAFDKVGAGRYSEELAKPQNAELRDQPMLDAMTRLALRALSEHSPKGFYLMVEGASIDKMSHQLDAERSIWDVIEFDNAIRVGLDFATKTNADKDPKNDTLVIVTADHETGGFALVGVGNERYQPQKLGKAVRDYAAVFRFFPRYERDVHGFPVDPDPPSKLLIGYAAAPDHFENWISNRTLEPPALGPAGHGPMASMTMAYGGASPDGGPVAVVANPGRDGPGEDSDNRTVAGQSIPGFLVPGEIENGENACHDCPTGSGSVALPISGHTATDVVLSSGGAGALQFGGCYENTAVFFKILRATTGAYSDRLSAMPTVAAPR
jgi:alkaline phosphatase